MRGQEVRSDGGDDPDSDGPAQGILSIGHIAASRFEFAKNSAGPGQESLAEFSEAHGTAEAVEETGAEFVLELADLLGKRRLGNMGEAGGAAEAARIGDCAEVTELVDFHRLCLSILSELYIRRMGGRALVSMERGVLRGSRRAKSAFLVSPGRTMFLDLAIGLTELRRKHG